MFLRNVKTNDYFYCIEELRIVGMTVEDVFFIIRTVTMLDGGALVFFLGLCELIGVERDFKTHSHSCEDFAISYHTVVYSRFRYL